MDKGEENAAHMAGRDGTQGGERMLDANGRGTRLPASSAPSPRGYSSLLNRRLVLLAQYQADVLVDRV